MKRIVTAVVLAVSSCATAPAMASSNCRSYDEVADILRNQAGESPIIASVTHTNTAMMFWINPETDTWTITETVGNCTYIRQYGQGVALIPMGEPV